MILVLLSTFVSGALLVSRWIFKSFPRALFVGENNPFSQGIPSASCLIFPLSLCNSLCVICFLRSDCVMSCMITFVFLGGSSIVLSVPPMIYPNDFFIISLIPSCNNFFLDIPSGNTESIPCRIALDKCCIFSMESVCVIPMK